IGNNQPDEAASAARPRASPPAMACGHSSFIPRGATAVRPRCGHTQRKEPAMQLIARSIFRTTFRIFAASFALSFAVWHAANAATPQRTFHDLKIEVVGKGRPVLMIPGLTSAGETWTETCAALQADHVQCHIVTLPGFAGLPSAADG